MLGATSADEQGRCTGLITPYMRLSYFDGGLKFKAHMAHRWNDSLFQRPGLGPMKARTSLILIARGTLFHLWLFGEIKASIQDHVHAQLRRWSPITGSTSRKKSLFFNMRHVSSAIWSVSSGPAGRDIGIATNSADDLYRAHWACRCMTSR